MKWLIRLAHRFEVKLQSREDRADLKLKLGALLCCWVFSIYQYCEYRASLPEIDPYELPLAYARPDEEPPIVEPIKPTTPTVSVRSSDTVYIPAYGRPYIAQPVFVAQPFMLTAQPVMAVQPVMVTRQAVAARVVVTPRVLGPTRRIITVR